MMIDATSRTLPHSLHGFSENASHLYKQQQHDTYLYMSPAERLVVFDRWGLGSPARLMSEEEQNILSVLLTISNVLPQISDC